MQEFLAFHGIITDHIAIRTSHYEGIERRARTIRIHGLGYLINQINADDSLLIVDDIFDTGRTIDTLIEVIQKKARRNTPNQIKVAAAWYKPEQNRTDRVPDFYINSTDKWVVFPHELMGLELDEIRENKPYIGDILEHLESISHLTPYRPKFP